MTHCVPNEHVVAERRARRLLTPLRARRAEGVRAGPRGLLVSTSSAVPSPLITHRPPRAGTSARG